MSVQLEGNGDDDDHDHHHDGDDDNDDFGRLGDLDDEYSAICLC